MSMLTRMRAGGDSPSILIILGIIVVTFVFWGVGNQGPSNQTMAEVNGERITDTMFNNEMRQQRSSRRGGLSPEAYDALSGQVLRQLITRRVLLQEVNRLGIEISDKELRTHIRETEAFANDDGEFSSEIYEQYAKSYLGGESHYEARLREDLSLGRLQNIVANGAQVSRSEIEERYIAGNTRLSLEYIEIGPAAMMELVEVPQEAIDALLTSSEERIQATYDQQLGQRFTQPRKASVRSIVMHAGEDDPDGIEVTARLQALRDDLAQLTDPEALTEAFAQKASEVSEDISATDGGQRGERSADQMGLVVTEAAFAAGAGALTEVVQTIGDFQLLLVESVQEESVTPYEEVRASLAEEILRGENLGETMTAFAQDLHARWLSEGEAPTDLLEQAALSIRAEPTANLLSTSLGDLPEAPELMAAARTAEPGALLPEVYAVGGSSVVARLDSRTDADMILFEDQQHTLELEMLQEEKLRLLDAWRNELVTSADIKQYWRPEDTPAG